MSIGVLQHMPIPFPFIGTGRREWASKIPVGSYVDLPFPFFMTFLRDC